MTINLLTPDVGNYNSSPAVELWNSDSVRQRRHNFMDSTKESGFKAPQTESVPEELQNSTKENEWEALWDEAEDIDEGTNSDSHYNQLDEDDIRKFEFSNDMD